MGKGLGVFGNFRKRVGNVVGYALKGSNNSQTQGLRIYQPVVSNPRTAAQAQQRMKFAPLSLFYAAFTGQIDHTFEGYAQGARTRQRFMSVNLSNADINNQGVLKGERILPPFDGLIVSQGSLGVSTRVIADGALDALKCNQVLLPATFDDNAQTSSVAEFSAALIAANPQLANGMEVGFIAILRPEGTVGAGYYAKSFFVVLNTADTVTSVSDIDNFLAITRSTEGGLQLEASEAGQYLAGAAVMVSRKNGSSWLQSNAVFGASAIDYNYFSSRYADAVLSYMNGASSNYSDNFMEQATGGVENSLRTIVGTATTSLTASSDISGSTLSQSSALLAIRADGSRLVVVDSADHVIGANGQVVTYTNEDLGAEDTPLPIDFTNLAGNPTIDQRDFQ